MFAVILALYLINIIGKAARVERLVKEKTSELELEAIERNLLAENLRKLNEFNDALFKAIPWGMDIVDANGCILYADEKIKKLLGIKEAAGKKCFTLYRDDKKQCRDCPLREGIEVGKTDIVEVEGVLGGRIYRITHTGMLYGGKKALLEVFEDITDRKVIENELRRLSSAIEHSPRDEFISAVSHELRTPLSIMREGVSQVVEGMHGGITEKQGQVLSLSLKNIDRLTRLISDLLDMSRIEAGRVEIKKGRADIVALAKRIVSAFYSSVSDKGLELRERYSKDTIEVEIDTDRITQVFTNLIGNAIKFTEKGDIEIAVEDKEDAVYCSVKDTGIGISESDLPSVFNKFEQFRPLSGGAGLGLAISKGIVEMHHGRIWVESRPGEGSRFIFTLPKGKGL